jgi:hypothetical protein
VAVAVGVGVNVDPPTVTWFEVASRVVVLLWKRRNS